MNATQRVVELKEYETRTFPEADFSIEQGKILHSLFGKEVTVEPPSFLNDRRWSLTSKGWVGYIPLTEDLHFSLVPKVPIKNLFSMLEYAYGLDFRVLEGLSNSESITDLYESLALILAKKVLYRIKKGLFRSYVQENDDLPYVRGRIDIEMHIRNPLRIRLPCDFQEHTPDLEDNQILLWTLNTILQSGICTSRSLRYIRQAHRSLLGFSSMRSFSPQSCVDRLYSRLNQDYEPMHALCRFFLEHSGPTHRVGDQKMLPFLLDMKKLFELFVVEWLNQNMPRRYQIRGQENVQFKMGNIVTIRIDITVENVEAGGTCFVLDTKYKAPEQPATSDVEQIVAYAEAKHCKNAALIYPMIVPSPIRGMWGESIHIESLAFRLDGDLENAGQDLITRLARRIEH